MAPTTIKVWGHDVALSYDLIAVLKEKGLDSSPLTLSDLQGDVLVSLPAQAPWTMNSLLKQLEAAEKVVGKASIHKFGAEATIGGVSIGSSEI